MVAPFDPDDLALAGDAVAVMEGIEVAGNDQPMFALSESGTLVYWSEDPYQPLVEFVWVSRSGEIEPVDPGWIVDAGVAEKHWTLSSNGRRLALKARVGPEPDIWIKELPDGPMRRLTTAVGEDRFPRFVPPGDDYVSFTTARNGGLDVWIIPADGSGPAELLLDAEPLLTEAEWSPDGEWLIVRTAGTSGQAGGRDILGMRPAEDSALVPLVVTESDESAPSVSPSGEWITYVSNQTGRPEVFVRPFPDTNGPEIQVSDGGGHSPRWARAGEELFYVSDPRASSDSLALMVASFGPGPSRSATRRRLFDVPEDIVISRVNTKYAVSPDDQCFLMARRVTGEGAGRRLWIVRNFAEEVRRQVGR
jgi:serine/threonine-protein kinase